MLIKEARPEEKTEIQEMFVDEKLFSVKENKISWFADFVNYLVSELRHQNSATTRKINSTIILSFTARIGHAYIG